MQQSSFQLQHSTQLWQVISGFLPCSSRWRRRLVALPLPVGLMPVPCARERVFLLVRWFWFCRAACACVWLCMRMNVCLQNRYLTAVWVVGGLLWLLLVTLQFASYAYA